MGNILPILSHVLHFFKRRVLVQSLEALAGAKVLDPDELKLKLMDAGMTQILMPFVLKRDTSKGMCLLIIISHCYSFDA